jgi:tRNA threonylcarbamoyladenosine biosynthesis protein TsaB
MILTIRTDKPESEVGLYEGEEKLSYEIWPAHRQLAETIHQKIRSRLEAHGKSLHDITAVIVYEGPGSFTGLRIGISVANALAYSLDIPITARCGEHWKQMGIEELQKSPKKVPVMPEYGAPVHITKPRK